MGQLGYQLPNPRTWPANAQIKAPYLRADVSDAVALLSAPPVFIAQQATPQSLASGSDVPVALDTEIYDNAFGHLDTVNPDKYYGQLAGWYLAQGGGGADYTGGTGAVKAAIGLSILGGALTTWAGQRLPCSGTAGRRAQPAAAKLILMGDVGSFGGSNDYASLVLNQTSGAAQNTYSAGSQVPRLQLRWVCAAAGTPGLITPANPLWPVPPAYITSAFLNANVRDTINFLIYPPVMEAFYQAGTQSLASQSGLPAVGTTVGLDTAYFDNYAAFNTATHTWTVPAGCAGAYWCYGQAEMSAAATCLDLAAGLTVTSANYNSGTAFTMWGGAQAAFPGGQNCAITRRLLRLNAGDTVTLAAFQRDSAAAPAALDYDTGGGFSIKASRLITTWAGA
jgi:hypothetical protein